MHPTHNTQNSSSRRRRFNRHNLPPNTAVGLVLLSEDFFIRCIVSAAARYTSFPSDTVQYDQLFTSQPVEGAGALSDVPVAEGHRTTVIFDDTPVTRRIQDLEGGCWAQIVIEKRTGTQLRPRITWQPLDADTWIPTAAAASQFPLPTLGECWPMAGNLAEMAEKNPVPWQLLTGAAVALGGMSPNAFQTLHARVPEPLKWLYEREEQLRASRAVERTHRMIEKLPAAMREQFMARLSATRS
jgi:hypothetical protein